MDWKKYVDPLIRTHLEKQIIESAKHNRAYEQAQNPANAQLWIAISNISKELFEVNLKLKYLEGALKEIGKKAPKKKAKKKK